MSEIYKNGAYEGNCTDGDELKVPKDPERGDTGSDKRFIIKRSACITKFTLMAVIVSVAAVFVVLYTSCVIKANKTTDKTLIQPNLTDKTSSTTQSESSAWSTTSASPSLTSPKAECPSDWLRLRTSCYYFSDSKLIWKNAFTHCLKLGGSLVEINDAIEDEFLITRVRNAKVTFWIGLTDDKKEDGWVWMTSKTEVTSDSYTNWSPGEPNNNHNNGEDCATINHDPRYKWNDEPCSYEYKYICEL